ncbi:MAG: hypothetical protein R2700_15855 [Solirubrobacterales bacterium]
MDPRPAHAAADVCIGMGGSALRAMAFAKPLIVQGEAGFWELLDASSEERFLRNGWYGVGPGGEGAAERLISQLRPLADDPALRAELGRRGRDLVPPDASPRPRRGAADRDLRADVRRRGDSPRRRLAGAARSSAGLVSHRFRRTLASVRGRGAADDFNSRAAISVGGLRSA